MFALPRGDEPSVREGAHGSAESKNNDKTCESLARLGQRDGLTENRAEAQPNRDVGNHGWLLLRRCNLQIIGRSTDARHRDWANGSREFRMTRKSSSLADMDSAAPDQFIAAAGRRADFRAAAAGALADSQRRKPMSGPALLSISVTSPPLSTLSCLRCKSPAFRLYEGSVTAGRRRHTGTLQEAGHELIERFRPTTFRDAKRSAATAVTAQRSLAWPCRDASSTLEIQFRMSSRASQGAAPPPCSLQELRATIRPATGHLPKPC